MKFMSEIKSLLYQSILVLFILSILSNKVNAQIYLDSTASVDERVEDLLSKMTLDEKIGQMIQVSYPTLDSTADISNFYIGSLLAYANDGPEGRSPEAWANLHDELQLKALKTRLKIPILFAIDAIHGIGAVYGSTIFPHNIGIGCTRDTTLVKQAAWVTAIEMSATGIDWNLGPVAAVARDERWGRTYESFGESPELVRDLCAAEVRGLQGDKLNNPTSVLACAKHFVGDGGTTGGVNAGDAKVDEQTLRNIHMKAYISAIRDNVGSIMISQSQWNGQQCHGNRYLLTDILKNEFGFKGILISDADSYLLAGDYNKDLPGTIANAVNSGMDMAMAGKYQNNNYHTFLQTLKQQVENNNISIERINDALRRILKQKFLLGLFEHPFANRNMLSSIGSSEHREIARECVRKSLVLLKKKDNILPISKNVKHICITGLHADNLGYQCGGWTISWQGASGNITVGTTIKQAIQKVVPNAVVTYSVDGYGAENADIGIAVIGETPYAEFVGDGKFSLSQPDIQIVRNLKSAGKPVIVILISGRPLFIDPIIPYSDAIIAAWLPGTEGEGITDVLFGDYLPSGLLSQTWARNISQIPINIGDSEYDPLFKYGYGITSFDNSAVGSAPEVYAANTGTTEPCIEISFNKYMAIPSELLSGFQVMLNDNIPISIDHLSLKKNDQTTIIITLKDSIQRKGKYTLSYSPGNIESVDEGQLAGFENLQVYNLLDDYKYVQAIPGKIEAENFNSKLGILTKKCSDEGNGTTLYHIDSGEWTEYYINVSQPGNYLIEYRISSAKDTGKIELIAKGKIVSEMDIPVTGSWDKWQTISTSLNLTEGNQIIRMLAIKGGFQLNWMQLSNISNVNKSERINKGFLLSQNYPNPFNPSTTISYSIPENPSISSLSKGGFVTLKVYDILGREIKTLVNEVQRPGEYKAVFNCNNLPSGVYLIKLQFGDFIDVKKCTLLK